MFLTDLALTQLCPLLYSWSSITSLSASETCNYKIRGLHIDRGAKHSNGHRGCHLWWFTRWSMRPFCWGQRFVGRRKRLRWKGKKEFGENSGETWHNDEHSPPTKIPPHLQAPHSWPPALFSRFQHTCRSAAWKLPAQDSSKRFLSPESCLCCKQRQPGGREHSPASGHCATQSGCQVPNQRVIADLHSLCEGTQVEPECLLYLIMYLQVPSRLKELDKNLFSLKSS